MCVRIGNYVCVCLCTCMHTHLCVSKHRLATCRSNSYADSLARYTFMNTCKMVHSYNLLDTLHHSGFFVQRPFLVLKISNNLMRGSVEGVGDIGKFEHATAVFGTSNKM